MNQLMKFWSSTNSLSLKQPANLLRLLLISRKGPWFPQGLFNCSNKNGMLCALYIKSCAIFKTSYNFIWYISSHTPCESKKVIYILKHTSCNYSTTYIEKVVDLASHMNNHITRCRAS